MPLLYPATPSRLPAQQPIAHQPAGRRDQRIARAAQRDSVPLDDQRQAEALGQVRLGEHLRDRARGQHRAPAQQHRVGEVLGHFLDVVGHHHHRGRQRVTGQHGHPLQQVLPAAEVQPGGGLVQQKQLGVGHQRPRDLHALALPLGQGGEPAPDQVRAAERVQELDRAGDVGGLVVLLPAAHDRVGAGEHQVDHFLGRRHPVRQRGAGQADPRPQLEHVGLAEPAAQDLGTALGREQLAGDDLQQRGLPGSVGADDDPALVVMDGPVHVAQQHGPAAPDADTAQPHHLVGHPAPSTAAHV